MSGARLADMRQGQWEQMEDAAAGVNRSYTISMDLVYGLSSGFIALGKKEEWVKAQEEIAKRNAKTAQLKEEGERYWRQLFAAYELKRQGLGDFCDDPNFH